LAPVDSLSADEARSLAVAASLGGPMRDNAADVLTHLGLIQLDPLTRVDKAHRLTCLARLADQVTASEIDAALWSVDTAGAFEAWVHAACLVPVTDWPLLHHSRQAALASPKRPDADLLAQVRAIIAAHPGGATMSTIEEPGSATKGWNWSARKQATEHMLRTGELICSTRRGTLRVFDLPERRLPGGLLQARPSREDALAAMACNALNALGIATTKDIAVYYNLATAAALTGLHACGAQQIKVDGWRQPGWLHPRHPATVPETDGRGPLLIGPFDNLIWDRARTRRIFGFDYIFEAYKPQAKRTYGYYVLALLENGTFTGRADITRDNGTLRILTAFPEPGTDPARFTASLNRAANQLNARLARTEHRQRAPVG
jgi:uncharacterized protein YcaQ